MGCRLGESEAAVRIGRDATSRLCCQNEVKSYEAMSAIQGNVGPRVLQEGLLESGEPFVAVEYVKVGHEGFNIRSSL